MTSKLLAHDRLIWSLIAVAYLILGIIVVVFAGPLSWNIREHGGDGAGVATTELGLTVGSLFVGAVFSAIATGRPKSPIIPWAAPIAGAFAAGVALAVLEPAWWGLLPLIPVALSVVGLLARREATRYRQQFENPDPENRPTSVDPSRIVQRSEPDPLLSFGGAGLLAAVGILAVVTSATVAPWLKPDVPVELSADGQVTIGVDNPVTVEVLYGINYPATGTILSDENDTLQQLVDDGTVELVTQGVSLPEESALAVPVLAAQACAFEAGGSQVAHDFISDYHYEFNNGELSDDVADVIDRAAEKQDENLTGCIDSGKYEYSAGKALEASSGLAQAGFPQIYVNGEKVQPETVDELAALINEEK